MPKKFIIKPYLYARFFPMKIGLIRHAWVNYRSKLFTTGKAYNNGRIVYDTTAVDNANLKINSEDFPVCYVSSQSRTIETAKMIYNGTFTITDELKEVKSTSLFLQNIPVPTLFRTLMGRAAWFLNNSKMPETKEQSMQRAQNFISNILSLTHRDTLLITHGFFMQCLKHELKKQGFKGRGSYFPKNVSLYVFENKKLTF